MWPNPQFWSHLLKKSLMENFIFCAVIGCVATFTFGAKHLSTGLWSWSKICRTVNGLWLSCFSSFRDYLFFPFLSNLCIYLHKFWLFSLNYSTLSYLLKYCISQLKLIVWIHSVKFINIPQFDILKCKGDTTWYKNCTQKR